MAIFKNTTGKLNKLNILPLDKEKALQALVESNLMTALDLHFLASEYPTTFGGRIDTLAVDLNGAPVIIEYKRNKNDNVINQALSYLKWLRAQKSEFFRMLMIDKLGKAVADSIQLDWNNPRVICIAESYSKFDMDTVEVVPLRIELFKHRFYEQDIFSLEPLNVPDAQAVLLPAVAIPKDSKSVGAEESLATVEALRSKANEATRQLFDAMQEQILAWDESIEEKATMLYVAYRVSKNFAEVHVQKNQLRIHLRPMEYNDPRGMVEKIPDGYNWTMNRRVYLGNGEDLDYVMGLIEQSYQSLL
ncbi:Predicted transport protein [Formivibrio citricus]|uniref:Predicted transport protein n=1 Tax=Formivibrio citricus TaxID=83765 RepID=A0A1I4Z2V5_9NEIS|nr:DUF5655 domain-containing protein [Formivibrio citricus]SFN44309.1 Predicted transport protein [Formivibrio citricus]